MQSMQRVLWKQLIAPQMFEWKILRHFYIVIGIIYFKLHNRICAFEYQTIFFSFRINFNYKISAILFLLTSAGIIHSPYFYGTQKFHPLEPTL